MRRRETSVTRAVVGFALSGLAVLALVGVAGVLAMRRLGTEQAVAQAERIATVAGRGVVEPRLTDGILRGDAASLLAIDALVSGGVLRGPIARVTILDAEGRILYADDPNLIGSTSTLSAPERDALRSDEAVTSDRPASVPEGSSGDAGPLLDVALPITTPGGDVLLFRASIPSDTVTASAEQLWRTFLPVLAVALLALALVQIPLALRLARRVRASQQERERLLRRAIESSDLERRRIAGDLHDGPVQELAGLSMSIDAAAEAIDPADPAAARRSVRVLRSALMGIYPPNVRRAGLEAAVADLATPLAEQGIATEMDVPSDLMLPPEVASLLFRASREALRNVQRHASASHVRIRVRVDDGTARLEVADDGVGFDPGNGDPARADGHIGLPLLRDLASDAGGTLVVDAAEGRGTTIRMEVPL